MSRYRINYEDSIDKDTGRRIAEIIAEHVRTTEQTLEALSENLNLTLKVAYNDKLAKVARRLNDNFQNSIATAARNHGVFSGAPNFSDDSITELYRNTEFSQLASSIQFNINQEVTKYYRIHVSTQIRQSEEGRTSAERYSMMMDQLESIAQRYQNRSEATINTLRKYQENPSYETVINNVVLIITGAISFFDTYYRDLDKVLPDFLNERRRIKNERIEESRKNRTQSKIRQDDAASQRRKMLEDEFY